ncbi:class I SAM-dependent methyltransferase [Ureibacillus thermophilus]|uniref:class I SAM-dependent methyltransferase n=1 Tax=Ureibacillus thermophilus TaxID=367743 RepID=UPI003619C9AD
MGTMRKDQWNPSLYDAKHSFVSAFGDSLVKVLTLKKGEKILDVGCGTGDLACQMADAGAKVVGIDSSEKMIAKAKEKYPHLSFYVKDVTQLDFHNEFDAVFSNAVLHWVRQPEKALKNIYTSLKKGGRFVAEFGGKGNVQKITDALLMQIKKAGIERDIASPWYFPSIGEYVALMEQVGFRVTLAMHFDRPTPLEGEDGLKNWIAMFASSFFEGINEQLKHEIIANVETALKPSLFENGVWVADYKRIRVVGIKE